MRVTCFYFSVYAPQKWQSRCSKHRLFLQQLLLACEVFGKFLVYESCSTQTKSSGWAFQITKVIAVSISVINVDQQQKKPTIEKLRRCRF